MNLRKWHFLLLPMIAWMTVAKAQPVVGDFLSSQMISQGAIVQGEQIRFILHAPMAKQVSLFASWVEDNNMQKRMLPMKKMEDAEKWILELSDLPSDLLTYAYIVDGIRIIDPANPNVIRDGNTLHSYVLSKGDPASYYRAQDVPHGTLLQTWYPSKTENSARRMNIYLPAGYEQGKEKYPVLYLLHGMTGDEGSWEELGRLHFIMDNLIAQKKAQPMIVVMPGGHVPNAAAPGYASKPYVMNGPGKDIGSGIMETSFPEVIQFVEKNYRVKKDKKNRAIAGLSMGGSHSLFISALYPDKFDYIGLFSAAFKMGKHADLPVYTAFDQNLQNLQKSGYKLYWIGMGKQDFLYQTCVEYRKKLDELGLKYQYHESDGGHTWSNWRKYMLEFVPLLFK